MRPRTGCVLVRQTFCLPDARTAAIGCSLALQKSGSQCVERAGKAFYEYVLVIDGNDDRGIDVAVMSRLPVLALRTHINEPSGHLGNDSAHLRVLHMFFGIDEVPGGFDVTSAQFPGETRH